MHTKQKAIRNFTKEEIEPLRKQGLIFKISDIFSDEYKIINGLRYAEREFCRAKKIDTAKFLRAKRLYRQNGIKSLLGLFRKYRIKKPISQEIIDMFEKNMSN